MPHAITCGPLARPRLAYFGAQRLTWRRLAHVHVHAGIQPHDQPSIRATGQDNTQPRPPQSHQLLCRHQWRMGPLCVTLCDVVLRVCDVCVTFDVFGVESSKTSKPSAKLTRPQPRPTSFAPAPESSKTSKTLPGRPLEGPAGGTPGGPPDFLRYRYLRDFRIFPDFFEPFSS